MQPVTNLISSNSIAGGRGVSVDYEVVYRDNSQIFITQIISFLVVALLGFFVFRLIKRLLK